MLTTKKKREREEQGLRKGKRGEVEGKSLEMKGFVIVVGWLKEGGYRKRERVEGKGRAEEDCFFF